MSARDPGFVKLYRLLLRAYPPSWRAELQAELLETLRRTEAEIARQPTRTRLRRRCREAWALLRSALAARFGRSVRVWEPVGGRHHRMHRGGRAAFEARNPPVGKGAPTRVGRPPHPVPFALFEDLLQSARALARTPGFTLVAVSILALGIAATTSVFSVVQAVLLQPLPYTDADRLVVVSRDLERRGITGYPAAPADLSDYRAQQRTFEAIAGFFGTVALLETDGETLRLDSMRVTPEFFSVLGTPPALGPGFRAEDGRDPGPGEAVPPRPVVLSWRLWQTHFGSDPDIIGRTVALDGTRARVAAVMPRGFRFVGTGAGLFPHIDLWSVMRFDAADPPRRAYFLQTIARLRAHVTLGAAQADLEQIAAWQRRTFANYEAAGTRLRVTRLHDDLTAGFRLPLMVFLGSVGFVLLIASANVANLLLVRGTGRHRELAVRMALGAGRVRIGAQLVGEAFLLAAAALVAALVIARLAVPTLLALAPPGMPRLHDVTLDGPVLAFSLATTLLSTVLAALLPALRASRPQLVDALKGRGTVHATTSDQRARGALVVAEVALSLILLVGAATLLRTFLELQRVELGFDAEQVLTFETTLPIDTYHESPSRVAFRQRLAQRLADLPGVEAVSAASSLPFSPGSSEGPYSSEEAMSQDGEEGMRQAWFRSVGPDYFRTMGTPLLRGRVFTAFDEDAPVTDGRVSRAAGPTPEVIGTIDSGTETSRDNDFASATTAAEGAPGVGLAIVDRRLAESLWPGEDPLGRRIFVKTRSPGEWVRVVGLVGNQRQQSLRHEAQGTIYFPDGQAGSPLSFSWVVRGSEPARLTGAIRAVVRKLDPRVSADRFGPLSLRIDEAMAPIRFALGMAGAFAGVALLLAAAGLYGVLAWTVRQRTAEIGVRMALGAARAEIFRLVAFHGLRLAGLGTLIGLVGALVLGHVLAALLASVEPATPATLVGAAVLFLIAALAAIWSPAWRATRQDPATVLESE